MKVGEELDNKGYGIATQAGSLLTEKLSRAILELKEDGSLTVMQQYWWIEKGDKCPAEGDKQVRLLDINKYRNDFSNLCFRLFAGKAWHIEHLGFLQDSKNSELKLNNVAGCFYILIIGLILSMVFALCEFLYKANNGFPSTWCKCEPIEIYSSLYFCERPFFWPYCHLLVLFSTQVPMTQAIKTKARFSVQGGAFKDPHDVG